MLKKKYYLKKIIQSEIEKEQSLIIIKRQQLQKRL